MAFHKTGDVKNLGEVKLTPIDRPMSVAEKAAYMLEGFTLTPEEAELLERRIAASRANKPTK